jgi:iron complex outermembrane receptor protein
VINIITRHDGSDGGVSAEVRSALGAASSAYVPRSAITQDHAVTIRQGSSAQSATLTLSSGGIGQYLPGAFVRRQMGSAGFRLVRSNFIVSATGRAFDSRSSDPFSPLFRDSVSATRAGLTTPESVREYTAGGSTTFIQSETWTHALVAGFDGSRVSNLADYHTPLPSATGPDVGTAGGSANLITMRASSVAKLGDAENLGANLTFSGESSLLDYTAQADSTSTIRNEPGARTSIQRRTTAGVAQANLSWRDAGYLTGGLRVERNDVLGSTNVSILPMIGAAAVQDYGPLTVKLRSAYGRGIRQAANAARETDWFDPRGDAHRLSLSPEEQSGIEAGVDFFFGKTFGFQVTRFDQLASGLIQRVAYTYSGTQISRRAPQQNAGELEPVRPGDRHIEYSFQNVGEITNRGWELKGDLNVAALSLGGTFSTVDSRVRRVASGYTGDLRVGDRMLDVPARTGSLTAAFIGASWTGSLTASRSWDWINYDEVALAGAFSNSTQTDAALVGQELRNYWLRYAGVTRLRASIGRNLYRGLAFTLSGENLLNRQHGEPDNITVVPGRTLTFGLKARL